MSTNHPLISVIIPVYMAECHISKCVTSIQSQTYNNIEIILVDDGSPDNSSLICEKLARTDSRIICLHKKNGGASDARNYGINHANGKWVCFVDSDDYVDTCYVENLVSAIPSDEECVLIIGGMKCIKASKVIVSQFENSVSCKEDFGKILSTNGFFKHGGPTCKLYLRQILVDNNITYNIKLKNYEDLMFNLSYIIHIDKIIYIDTMDYTYLIDNSSMALSNNGYDEEIELWKSYVTMISCFDNDENSLLSQYSTHFVFRAIQSLYMKKNGYGRSDRLKRLKELRGKIKYKFEYGESVKLKLIAFALRMRMYHIVDFIVCLLYRK